MFLRLLAATLGMAFLGVLAGCVSHPPASLVQPWPETPPEGYATLLMYDCDRGGGVGPAVWIDDKRVFTMHGNSYTWCYVKAGHHRFQTKWIFLLKGMNADRNIKCVAGKSYFLRLIVKSDNNPYYMTVKSGLPLVPEEIAKAQALRTWYRKPDIQKVDVVSAAPFRD